MKNTASNPVAPCSAFGTSLSMNLLDDYCTPD